MFRRELFSEYQLWVLLRWYRCCVYLEHSQSMQQFAHQCSFLSELPKVLKQHGEHISKHYNYNEH